VCGIFPNKCPGKVEESIEMNITKRQFALMATSFAFSGLARQQAFALGSRVPDTHLGYGPLVSDPEGLLDLPEGFSYSVISRLGDTMTDGFKVPDNADGMGCFGLDETRVSLVRNHELKAHQSEVGPAPDGQDLAFDVYDARVDGVPLPGGTTTLIYNMARMLPKPCASWAMWSSRAG